VKAELIGALGGVDMLGRESYNLACCAMIYSSERRVRVRRGDLETGSWMAWQPMDNGSKRTM
jgi:hypothetical protein